jgi:UDP-GlcNAc:undecaprenyl-phosphate GlcNAc-1-phosphate transferase
MALAVWLLNGITDSVLPEVSILYPTGALRQLAVLISGAAAAVILGLIDDKVAMGAGVKFSGQFLIALLTVIFGGIRFQLAPELPQLSGVFTVFWIMLMMNSINFFDNMDGLAIGTVAIAMALFAVIAAMNYQYLIASFAALNCGVACGFWFYNTNPASIFMGDSGSHFIGYLAAVVACQVTFFDVSYSLSRFPVLMPLFILALPLFDTAMVVIIRSINKKPFWIGDHNHISHRFVRMGLSRPQAVFLVHILALTIGLGILPVFWGEFHTAVLLIIQSLLILAVITYLQFKLSKKEDARE